MLHSYSTTWRNENGEKRMSSLIEKTCVLCKKTEDIESFYENTNVCIKCIENKELEHEE